MGGGTIRVDHEGLQQMHDVSGRQASHLSGAQGYINANCARTEAFGGVLEPFRGTYETVVTNANNGMRDAQQFSTKMSNALHHARQTYLDTDEGEKTRWETTTQRAEGVRSKGLANLGYDHGGKPIDDILGIHSKTKDPLTAAQDKLKDKIRKGLGVDTSTERHEKVDEEARRRNKDQVDDRARETRNDRSTGQTKAERKAAARAGRQTDKQDIETRRNLLTNTVAPVKDTFDSVKGDLDKTKDIVKDLQQAEHTSHDIDDYDDYESRGNSTDDLRKQLDS